MSLNGIRAHIPTHGHRGGTGARQRRFADENEAIAARLEEREAGRELAPFYRHASHVHRATAREIEVGHEICADATCGTCHHSYMDHYGVCLKPDCLLCREQIGLPFSRWTGPDGYVVPTFAAAEDHGE